ncbi:MAG: hypothetical protein CM15mP128_0780 [Methanobacteriota archaeon]|nr:MAG: hypothetical protein CM15mP128_0780 [Euryarchaeota archaeon]
MAGKEYRTITDVKGPLVFLNKTEPVAYGEIVSLRLSMGTSRTARCLTRPTTWSSCRCSKAPPRSTAKPA